MIHEDSVANYVRVRAPTAQALTYQKITILENKFPENKFVRIHRSFVVTVNNVSSFTYNAVKVGELEIPIGRIYKQQAMKVLNQHNAML